MTDFFKSAFGNIFSSNQTSSKSTSVVNTDEFIGRNVVIANYKLKIIRALAEGGYAIVYLAQDITNGTEYAVKRMFAADKSANRTILEEINFLKQVNNHPFVLKFIAAACEDSNGNMSNNHQRNEYLVLTELCKGGSLIDFIRQNELNNEQVLQVFYQISKAVQYLHSQDPAIVHRDIKIDNFLISNDGAIKLCDFGSATISEYYPNDTWTHNKRSLTEDEIAKHTTPMYRAPEMLDLYSNYPINKQADIWALGCVLYAMCFNKHPYEDSAKLRIINGNYTIPNNSEFSDYHDLIRCMFNIDPRQRPTIDEVVYHLENISETKSIKLQPKLKFLLNQSSKNSQSEAASVAAGVNQNNGDSTKWMGNAANIFKTIKEASSKVIDTMQQSINRTDIDISYITSRLIVMSCPYEGIESTAFGNNIDLIKEAIERKHSINYNVYNLSNKNYHKEKFTKVIDVANLTSTKSPSVSLIMKVCANIIKYLQQKQKNVCIIHCVDGKALSAVLVCSLLLIYGVAKNVDSSILIFTMKRSCSYCLTASQYRYLNYIDQLVNQVPPFIPLTNEFSLTGITIQSIPLFNRTKNGCTPYFEVYCREKKLFTNFSSYEGLKKYTTNDVNIRFNVNCKLYGDVTIVVYHAKSLLGGGKLTSSKICQVQFHTGFITCNKIKFKHNELDETDTSDKYTESFSLTLDIEIKNSSSPLASEEAWNSIKLDDMKDPQSLFTSNEELNELILIMNASNRPYNDSDEDGARTIGQSKFFEENRDQYEGMLDDTSDIDDDDLGLANKFENNLKLNRQPVGDSDLFSFDDNDRGAAPPTSIKTASNETKTQKVKTAFDLLGDFETETIIETPATIESSIQNEFEANFDLFSNIPQTTAANNNVENLFDFSTDDNDPFKVFDAPVPAATQPVKNNNKTNSNDIFDPFAPLNSQSQADFLKPQQFQQQKSNSSINDPFASLSGFPKPQQQQQQATLNQPKPSNLLFASKPTSPQESPLHKPPNSTTLHATKPQPAFNISAFSKTAPPANSTSNKGGVFDEFLPGEFLKQTKAATMSLNEKRREIGSKDIDPDKQRVADWTDGKKKNIRALLCSLDKVLWEGETKWKPVGMHDLVTADQVKKAFRKAVLAVHPDKLTDHPQLNLARLIFIELNCSWEQFENEGQKSLF